MLSKEIESFKEFQSKKDEKIMYYKSQAAKCNEFENRNKLL